MKEHRQGQLVGKQRGLRGLRPIPMGSRSPMIFLITPWSGMRTRRGDYMILL
jgi:hypothetical protein